MVIIRFRDDAAKRRALGYLFGRFSFRSWANGEMMVPQDALPELAAEGIECDVVGAARYEHFIPRIAASAATKNK